MAWLAMMVASVCQQVYHQEDRSNQDGRNLKNGLPVTVTLSIKNAVLSGVAQKGYAPVTRMPYHDNGSSPCRNDHVGVIECASPAP